MANVIRHKRGTSTPAASDFSNTAEILVDTNTGNIFNKTDGNAVVKVNGLANIVEDTTPQLGGDLLTNGNDIDFADNDKAKFGTQNQLLIFHDGTHSFLQDNGTGDLIIYGTGEDLAKFKDDGSVELYYDGSKKFETTSDGATVSGDLTIDGSTPELRMKVTGDEQSHRIRFFNTADSMVARIFGDPSTGNLSLQTGTNGAEEAVKCISNGAVEIYYDGVKQIETSSTGAIISGGVLDIKNTGAQSELRLYCESSNAHYASLKAPAHADFSGNLTYTLPSGYGSSGQVLQTDGSGGTSWVAQSGGSSTSDLIEIMMFT
jgi:hypothetical protein